MSIFSADSDFMQSVANIAMKQHRKEDVGSSEQSGELKRLQTQRSNLLRNPELRSNTLLQQELSNIEQRIADLTSK